MWLSRINESKRVQKLSAEFLQNDRKVHKFSML